MHINRLMLTGITFLVLTVLIILFNPLNTLVLKLTYPFLMGSSEGKAIIFFFLMGSLLVLNQFLKNSKLEKTIKSKSGNYYLKLVIIIIVSTFILGLLLEIWIRAKFGVSVFTTVVSTTPSVSTSSIIHSHVFKSMLGILISDTRIYVPMNIHTGISIAQYVPKFAMIIFAVFPAVYILGLLSLSKRNDLQTIILIFSISTSMIGMLDGGLFSAPALVGLSGILGIYFIKKPFSYRNLIKPSSVIVLLLIIRVLLGLVGSHPDIYEITVIGNNNVDLTGYDVLSEKIADNKTVITVSSNINELSFINQTFNLLKDKNSLFFVSWNIYSFL